MQLSIPLSLAAILGFQASVHAYPLLAPRAQNKCGDSTFHDFTQFTSGSPMVSDCQKLSENLSGNGVYKLSAWDSTLDFDKGPRYKSCWFSLQTGNINVVSVGDGDIQDLIRDSIANFSKRNSDGNMVIGAYGDMGCGFVGASSAISSAKVVWNIKNPL